MNKETKPITKEDFVKKHFHDATGFVMGYLDAVNTPDHIKMAIRTTLQVTCDKYILPLLKTEENNEN